ncbi:uncharacterized protein LOC132061909 [Lycium ferocissimum]|uniref:uncharacterized protein LOC132061909 n=1 Tax=Lycium ferocissimum TaxID=112874 RepID=UPI002815FB91|nr:uncharacterized protein LOC132061909 [Lycium ferocissimum]
MRQLSRYELISGQRINATKSCFITATHTDRETRKKIKKITGFSHKTFPFTYLGCPIFTGRKNICYFTEMTTKILKYTGAWQGNLLSFGGKAAIIQQVLQSQTMHVLAAMTPPKDAFTQIEKYLQDLFWGHKEGKKKHHWASWKYLCFPKDECGAGFKSLFDIQTAFAMKRWWRLRTQDNLWTKFMNAKYYKRVNLVARKWTSGQSRSWKELMLIKQFAEPHMLWKINKGKVMFWWDNWTGIGPLSLYVNGDIALGNMQVRELIIEDRWNNEMQQILVPPNLHQYINQIQIFYRGRTDQCYWMLTQDGTFICASARENIRCRQNKNDTFNAVWHKDLPFKISFLIWRIFFKRLPLDNTTVKFRQGNTTVVYEISFNLKIYLRKEFGFVPLEASWRDLCILVDAYKPKLKVIPVCWLKPAPMLLKLNTDGSLMSSTNKAGGGGILRDHQRNLIMAFSVSMIYCSNNMAET